MKRFPELYAYLARIVKHHVSQSPVILDLGVGPGLLSIEILKQIQDATIIGVDPIATMLRLAQENARQATTNRLEFIQGVSEKIPFKNDTVDVIISRFSLPYWKHPQESFAEMRRVVKPGGKVIIEALNRNFPAWKLSLIKLHMLFNRAGRDVTKYHIDAYKLAHTMEQIEELFTHTGFTILEKEGKKNEWRFIIVAGKK